jgi:hypothetical protein
MSTDLSLDRHSSVADFELLAHNRSYDVAQVAPEFLILETPTEIPPGPATLVIRLEGEEIRRQLTLPDGATCNSTRVRICRE